MSSSGKKVASEKTVQNKETPKFQGAIEELTPKKETEKVPIRGENKRGWCERSQMKKMLQERGIIKYVSKMRVEN